MLTYFIITGNLEKYQDVTIVSFVVNPEEYLILILVGNGYIEAKKNMDPKDFTKMFKLIHANNCYKEDPEWEKETNIIIFEKGNISL